ncbi:MAG: hypothetical protein RIC80_02865 [Cyclobacteriaceae bacterium]
MPKYLIFALFIFLTMYSFQLLEETGKEQIEIDMSKETLYNLLESAKEDISKQYLQVSEEHLDLAIAYLENIEQSLDNETNSVIDEAIAGLRVVEQDIRSKIIYEDDLNVAFAKAMNALAFAHLVVCEEELNEGELREALQSLKAAINHLEHSMKYSSGELLETEEALVKELADLSSSGDITVETVHKDVEKVKSIILSKE